MWDRFRVLFPGMSETETAGDGFCTPTREEYYRDSAGRDRIFAVVILYMALGMESLMLLLYALQKTFVKQHDFYPNYIYLYAFMIVFAPVMLRLFRVNRERPEALLKLEGVLLSVLGLWSAVFSALDVINGYSSYLLIQILIIDSLIFRIQPGRQCLVNIGSFLLYAGLLLAASLDITTLFVELINPCLMTVVSCVLIAANSRIGYSAFINHRLISEQNRKLAYYADYDFLTHIPNRKKIIESMERLQEGGREPVMCLMIDIDDFKLYNDCYGHLSGDECLTVVANLIGGYAESRGGIAGRYGGEEFVAGFCGVGKEEAGRIADGLVHLIEGRGIAFGARPGRGFVTVSVGVAITEPGERPSLDSLLRRADRALYRAKAGGKNQYSFYVEQPEEGAAAPR